MAVTHIRFLKNAASNIITGASSAVLAIVLPYFFVRIFSHAEFSLWILALQLAAYVNFFNFGIQTAIGRYVAFAIGRNNLDEAQKIVGAGLQLLTVLAIAAFCLIATLAAALPVLFTKIDPGMIGTGRSMLLWIGGALAIGLPFTAYFGVFVGLQRNDVPAMISLVSKAGLAVALLVAARATHDLEIVARVYFVVSVLGSLLQFFAFKLLCPEWQLQITRNPKAERSELISYCASLSVWSFSMLLVNGLSTTIVGIFDFANVGAFGVALNVVAFLTGLFSAVVSPLLQVFTHHFARGDTGRLLRLLYDSTAVSTLVLLTAACWMSSLAPDLFRLWIGRDMAAVSVPVFVTLVFAYVIRNNATPYANYLLAVGEQRKVYTTPLAEGVSNSATSVGLASLVGALGVAWGTVVGAIVGNGLNYFYNFKRTTPEGFSRIDFAKATILKPLLLASPQIGVLVATYWFGLGGLVAGPLVLTASIPVFVFLGRWGLKSLRSR